MIKRWIYGIVGSLVLCVGTVSAQRTLSLEECREMALENNAKMKNARLDVEGAREGKKEAFTKYFPNVSAVGTAFSFFRFGIKKTVTKPHLYRDSCAFDTTASIVRCGRPSGCTHLRTCIRNSMFPSGPLMGEKSRPTAEKPF